MHEGIQVKDQGRKYFTGAFNIFQIITLLVNVSCVIAGVVIPHDKIMVDTGISIIMPSIGGFLLIM
jgi:hypothetical protein